MEQIPLQGGTDLITTKKECCYRVISGRVLVHIASMEREGEIERKFFLYETDCDNLRIPAFQGVDDEGTVWVFVLSALSEAMLSEEVPPEEDWEGIIENFAEKIKLSGKDREDFKEELIEGIQRQLVTEELFLYRNASEQDKIIKQSLTSIASVFHKKKEALVKTNNNLYNTVAFLCKEKGIPIAPYEAVVESCGRRFTLQDIARISHFMLREVRLEKMWYACDSGDLIAYMENEEDTCTPVACISQGNKKYILHNLEAGLAVKMTEDLNSRFVKTAYMVYRPLPNSKTGAKELIWYGMKELKTKDVLVILLFTLFGTLIGLLIPYFNQIIYDEYIPFGSQRSLLFAGLLVLAFSLGNVSFLIVKNLALYRISVKVEYTTQSAVFGKLFHLPERLYETHDSSELAKSAFGVTDIINQFTEVIITSALSGFFSLLYYIRMMSYSKELAGMGLFMVMANSMLILIFGMLQLKYEKIAVDCNMKESASMYQFINGIAKLRIAGAHNRAIAKYMDIYTSHKKILMQKDKLIFVSSGINQFLSVLFLAIFYIILIHNKLNLSLGHFMGFVAAYGAFSAAIVQLATAFLKTNRFIPVYQKAKVILEAEEEYKEGLQMIGSLEGNIEVNNLYFSYQGGEENVLADVNFKINSGEYVGIVGASGSGKSTLLKLLMGFEQPISGKIYYDNKDIEGLDKRELRKCFGVVLQEGKLIAGSIYENIAIASVATTKEEKEREVNRVWEVVKDTGLSKDISEMPMGLQTIIAEGAGGISGGQCQKILIARAIFNNPQILFFDEATSALDNRNQSLVTENLEKRKVTKVVIAHRLSTVKNCDRILVMDGGRIVESGTYEELLTKTGYFYQLALRQMA